MPKYISRERETWHLNFDVDEQTGCWNWKYGLNADGYGWIRMDRKNTGAHRVAYRLFVGEIPEGMVVRHKCHNRRCGNYKHLLVGTQQDNIRDMMEAGRSKSPKRFFKRNHGAAVSAGLKKSLAESKAKGIRRKNQSKLTMADAREIRRLAQSGVPRKELAVM